MIGNLDAYRDILEVIYYTAAIIGIPTSIFAYLLEKRRERQSRELDTYLQTYDRYIAYLQQTLDHKELQCGEFIGDEPELKQSGFSFEQITLYTMLTMSLEQSYFLCTKLRFCRKNDIGRVWLDYITWWTTRPDFQKAWATIDGWYQPCFKEYVTENIKRAKAAQSGAVYVAQGASSAHLKTPRARPRK